MSVTLPSSTVTRTPQIASQRLQDVRRTVIHSNYPRVAEWVTLSRRGKLVTASVEACLVETPEDRVHGLADRQIGVVQPQPAPRTERVQLVVELVDQMMRSAEPGRDDLRSRRQYDEVPRPGLDAVQE